MYTQVFVSGMKASSTGDMNLVISGFPTFKVGSHTTDLGWMAYGGLFIGWNKMRYGRYCYKHCTVYLTPMCVCVCVCVVVSQILFVCRCVI